MRDTANTLTSGALLNYILPQNMIESEIIMTSIRNLRTTIGALLSRQSERSPDREALVHVDWGTRYTYAQLGVECGRLAHGLMELGISKGDHVCVWATNYPKWVVRSVCHREHWGGAGDG